MAFVASIDRQLELELAGSCMKIGHHTVWHCDAQVPLMDCPLWIKRNIMKERLMCIVFCALDVAVMKTGKKTLWSLPCRLTPRVWGRWEPGAGALGSSQLLFFCVSSTESSPGMYTTASLGMFPKLPPFFQQSFCMSEAFRDYFIPSVRLQTHWHGLHCPDLPFA